MKRFWNWIRNEAGFASEEDVADWITNTRREENAE